MACLALAGSVRADDPAEEPKAIPGVTADMLCRRVDRLTLNFATRKISDEMRGAIRELWHLCDGWKVIPDADLDAEIRRELLPCHEAPGASEVGL